MFFTQKKTSTHRASSDRRQQKTLESSTVPAQGPAPMRASEQASAYPSANAAARPTTTTTSPPDPFESRNRLAPLSRAFIPQYPVVGQTTTTAQSPSSFQANATNLGYAAANAHSIPDARAGVAKVPNFVETSVSASVHTPPPSNYQPPPTISTGPTLPNILIFGETGTGKSSLINMLAGQAVAGVSGDALGYTFGSQAHDVSISGHRVKLWDTAGLNEGEHGTVPAEQAMQNLQDLVSNLKGGVNLLVYCIRGTRFRDIMQINYDLFCSIICQNSVPVVIVVTGLENESPMESWWDENGAQLKAHGMTFAGHACVTTTKGKQLKSGEYVFEEEFEESEGKTQKLVTDHYLRRPWIMDERAWLADITSKLAGYYERQTYGGTDFAENQQNMVPTARDNSALVLMGKLAGLLLRGFNYFTSFGPPQQSGQTYRGTQPTQGRM